MITQSQLKEILHYNPDTGIFTWNITRRNAIKGSIAGYAQKEYRFNYIVIRIGVLGKNYLAHRLAWLYMTGSFPTKQIDHINHDATDNRWSNLQEVTNLQNGRNQSLHSTNTSGHMGVSWNKNKKKWQSIIKVLGKQIWLGYFNTIEEAIQVRKEAEQQYGFHTNMGKPKSAPSVPSKKRQSSSGVTGVSWNKNKWQARKRINGVQKNIGYFNSIQEAKDAIDNYTA
jgi:hypothetical protein